MKSDDCPESIIMLACLYMFSALSNRSSSDTIVWMMNIERYIESYTIMVQMANTN